MPTKDPSRKAHFPAIEKKVWKADEALVCDYGKNERKEIS